MDTFQAFSSVRCTNDGISSHLEDVSEGLKGERIILDYQYRIGPIHCGLISGPKSLIECVEY